MNAGLFEFHCLSVIPAAWKSALDSSKNFMASSIVYVPVIMLSTYILLRICFVSLDFERCINDVELLLQEVGVLTVSTLMVNSYLLNFGHRK